MPRDYFSGRMTPRRTSSRTTRSTWALRCHDRPRRANIASRFAHRCEDRKVIVRVPDLAAVEAQRAAVANQVATAVQAVLSDPQQRERLLAAPPEAAVGRRRAKRPRGRFKAGARTSRPGPLGTHRGSAQRHELADARCACPPERGSHRPVDGPESGGAAPRWHRGSPVGRSRSLQGDPHVDPERRDAGGLEGRAATHDARQRRGCDDSRARDEDPSTRSRGFGFSLEGDLQEATGNTTAAETAYTQAAKIRPSPSLSRRMQKLQVKEASESRGRRPRD